MEGTDAVGHDLPFEEGQNLLGTKYFPASRTAVLAAARERLTHVANAEKERQALTSKHDLARILHLRVDPSAAGDWTAALREKTRVELDTTDQPDADPWNRLVEKFNNYEVYSHRNG
eukprot:scaffold5419_cov186-Ochromonas_danica.AAC.2